MNERPLARREIAAMYERQAGWYFDRSRREKDFAMADYLMQRSWESLLTWALYEQAA